MKIKGRRRLKRKGEGRTEKQLAQQDHQNMLEGNELEEEQDKVCNAFQLYMKSTWVLKAKLL